MKQFEKQLRALESAEEPNRYEQLPEGRLGRIVAAQRICFALREGGNALEEITEAGAALDPERHAKLTETLEGARKVAAAVVRYCGPLVPGAPLSALVASVGPLKTEGATA